MTIIQDDRTDEQKNTHPILVIGTDKFMSGWGHAEGGASYAAWACKAEDESQVLAWVSSRSDMKRVRVTADLPGAPYRPSRACAHLHIYVVDKGHPALSQGCVA